jgi:hypothetical protein
VRAGIVGVVAVISACATTTSAIGPGHTPDPDHAYLYGRFFIKADEQEGSFVGHPQIVLRVWCRNSQQYSIAFSTKRDVQVLKVDPSRCALIGATFTDQNGIVRQRVNLEPKEMVFHDYAAGRAYYLGDYFARGILEVSLRSSYTLTYLSWAMDPADDRLASTTAEMRTTFPNLAVLPIVDKRLVPPKPPPKRGAVVITDAKEPPMTPERIARVAPFIKRTFSSPAACEAACAKGQCLPFRGEAGAAMTCVIRCNTDKDCPDGLACNCPNDERPDGPDCHPIAVTPVDRMARICLPSEAAPAAAATPPPN